MSNDDRDIPEFDDLDLPDEMLEPGDQTAQPTDAMMGPTEEMTTPDEGTVEPLEAADLGDFAEGDAPTDDFAGPLADEDLGEQPDQAEGELDEESAAEEEEEGGKKKKKKRAKKPKREKKEREPGEGVFQKLFSASPYTVMLGISLAAILVGILCLFLELQTYNLDIKAKEAKQKVGAAPAVQLGSPSTIAAA